MGGGARRSLIQQYHGELVDWPHPDITVLDDATRRTFLNRKLAVELYAADIPYGEIQEQTKFSPNEVRRLLRRCVASAGEGCIVGFYALLPSFRIKPYFRTKPIIAKHPLADQRSSGYAGALAQLFEKFPDVKKDLIQKFFLQPDKQKKSKNSRSPQLGPQPYIEIHGEFLSELRTKGVGENEWPFLTEDKGRRSLLRFLHSLKNERSERAVKARMGAEATNNLGHGMGPNALISPLLPFAVVELDYTVIDIPTHVRVIDPNGTGHLIPISRWYLGLLVEVKTSAILGAHISLEVNPSADCALQTMLSSVPVVLDARNSGDVRIEVRSTNMDFVARGPTLICSLIPQLAWQAFSLLRVDNGWCNIANDFVNNVIDVFGCAIEFGPPRAWWGRSLVERIIGVSKERGEHRLKATYASGPDDVRRPPDVEQLGLNDGIDLDFVVDMLNAVVREHNTISTGDRLNGATVINVLQRFVDKHELLWVPQPLPRSINSNDRLLMHRRKVEVRGEWGVHTRRPYINTAYCRYTNPRIASDFSMIGRKVFVYINRLDAREAWASDAETGENLGKLYGEEKWENWRCALRVRELVGAKAKGRPRGRSPDIYARSGKVDYEFVTSENSGENIGKKTALAIAKVARDSFTGSKSASLKPAEEDNHNNNVGSDNDLLPNINPRGIFKLDSGNKK